ncbi:MAG: serine/threonine-protein phosphatase [Bdellovibrionales bacterium]|nr:serine/threonine-protein phosphatase [Bdellovibrionales bacterium]
MSIEEGMLLHLNDFPHSMSVSSEVGQINLLSRPAPSEKRVNEDACGVRYIQDTLVLVVADGLGGHKNGHLASEIVVKNLLSNWQKNEDVTMESMMTKVEESHKLIKDLKAGSGSTVVVALVYKNTVRFLSVGDSRGFLISGHRNFKYKTLEQSPTGLAVESGFLEAGEALEHEDSHLVLSALGHDPLRMEVTGPIELSDRDFVLLASDGLTSNLIPEDFAEHLSIQENLSPLDEIAEKVEKKMLSGGSVDDLSMVLFMNGKTHGDSSRTEGL